MLSEELLDAFNGADNRKDADWLWEMRDKVLVLEEQAEKSWIRGVADRLGLVSDWPDKTADAVLWSDLEDLKEEIDDLRDRNRILKRIRTFLDENE